MTGPEHYEIAVRLITGRDAHPELTQEALVHATLALAAATAERSKYGTVSDAWAEVLT
jgi:hypothetical protein